MKKLIAAISIVIYFVVSTGFVVSVHYCMNKFDSISIGDSHSDECGKCGMHVEDSMGCCKDDVKVMKMQVDQSFAKIVSTDFSLHLPLATFIDTYLISSPVVAHASYPLAHGPPLSEQDTYLQNCVFRL